MSDTYDRLTAEYDELEQQAAKLLDNDDA